MKYKIESLGCSKNLVDSEEMVYILSQKGYEMTDDISKADFAIVNTCGFIEDAKKESIQTIFDVAEYKKQNLKYLIVTGCMVQRYYKNLKEEIPEIDALLGTTSYDMIDSVIKGLMIGKNKSLILNPNKELSHENKKNLTAKYYSYLKIAEGCDNSCTYCIIPALRGRYKSKKKEQIINEAKKLASNGVKELILIAQDTSKYGLDLYDKKILPELLQELSEIAGLKWIRFLYTYPEDITDELVDVVAKNEKICSYFDIPVQHSNDRILKLMNRSTSKKDILSKINLIRSTIPDAVIRTTLITGFPTETETEHKQLVKFIKEVKFDKLGAFTYSREEGTVAGNMNEQIKEDVKLARQKEIMDAQYEIVQEKNKALLGKTFEVVIDEINADYLVARSYRDVIEVDTVIIVKDFSDKPSVGDFIKVEITDILDYDLEGKEVI
ncbi:30S ribosomal protein S12 methylthiotransferase RimO [Criibacterium bergeronii]|uniref:Ribosomal protein uS12 methylthiotransferase RimO n=1 Tax=Criibacterium bergeronii TaxID=1871336 RepID=A0A552V3I5_9FIRM|nr:30S ribosomal protein S12 methylthiotransferase RimO [Criibacterium bergeronii]TRW25029.1 30S ribosomal protein S12 methylthiotransferase RimO [Criibacterium bergeronii]